MRKQKQLGCDGPGPGCPALMGRPITFWLNWNPNKTKTIVQCIKLYGALILIKTINIIKIRFLNL